MISRLARLCLVVALSHLVFLARAQNPPPAPGGPLPQNAQNAVPPPQAPNANNANANNAPAPAADEELVRLMLPDADIDTVLTALEIYTGKIILRPQQLQTATYNLKITKEIPKSEAILAIETVLALNGISIAPLGDRFLKVVNNQNIRNEAPEMITGSAFEHPASGKVGTKVFQLEFMRIAEFVPLLQGILNPFFGGPVQLPVANAVLITDSISNLQRVERLLQQLDQPVTAGMKPKFYPLTEAKASDVVNKLRTILTGTLQQQLGSATSYSADDRTNQIILVTDPRQYQFFDDLIERLDQRADPTTRNDVIYLKHAKAEEVVTVLSRIISGQNSAIQRQNSGSVRPGMGALQPPVQPGAPPQPAQPNQSNVVSATAGEGEGSSEFSSIMTVVNDDRSNSVVVSGTLQDIRLVKELIAKLDIVLAQVRIEVVIAEVTLADEASSGISELGLKVEGDKLVGFFGFVPGMAVVGPDGGDGSFATITRPGATGPWDLAGIISLSTTPRKDNTTILSVPTITTSHAKEASVFVGETRPVISGSVISGVGGGTTSTTTQLQIGINLTVTPLIGIDGSVQLDIKQDVDEVGGDVIIDGNSQPIILKRTTASFVSVKSGEIIVLGGLQRQSKSRTTSRLGPIPIIGDLFGARSRSEARTELVFFLRPYVLTNTPADNESTFKRINELPQREAIRQHIDPNYVPEKKSVLDNILPD